MNKSKIAVILADTDAEAVFYTAKGHYHLSDIRDIIRELRRENARLKRERAKLIPSDRPSR